MFGPDHGLADGWTCCFADAGVGGKQFARIRGSRVPDDIIATPRFDHPAVAEYHQMVGALCGKRQIMRD